MTFTTDRWPSPVRHQKPQNPRDTHEFRSTAAKAWSLRHHTINQHSQV